MDFESGLANLISQYRGLKDAIELGNKKPNGIESKPSKRPPKRLIVTLSNGTEIERGEQWETFMEAIEIAGPKRVCKEEFGTPSRPLVKCKDTDAPLEEGYRPDSSGNYSICTNYPATDKADHLKDISEKFGLQWKVEVIER